MCTRENLNLSRWSPNFTSHGNGERSAIASVDENACHGSQVIANLNGFFSNERSISIAVHYRDKSVIRNYRDVRTPMRGEGSDDDIFGQKTGSVCLKRNKVRIVNTSIYVHAVRGYDQIKTTIELD